MIIIQANGAERDLEEKILALLRREDIAAERVSLSSRHTLTFPALTIDGRSLQAFQNGTALALTRIEFNMLLLLASNPGITLSKEDLSTIGGHLTKGCIINTTCELVIGILDGWRIGVEQDDETGYDELIFEEV